MPTRKPEEPLVSAIPEPSTYAALAGLAILGVAATRRRRSV
ncbi:MAG: PEP-CTERM sorting domain-containing protein [Verrucomicrobia bacterium]|nr:PEP-CTERM sorting domain-containing protein [Verrucomicrobiota bacterium]